MYSNYASAVAEIRKSYKYRHSKFKTQTLKYLKKKKNTD